MREKIDAQYDGPASSQGRRDQRNTIRMAPQDYGTPLRKTLKGYWKLRVGNYRVVYKISGGEIRILGICHRRDVYLKMLARK